MITEVFVVQAVDRLGRDLPVLVANDMWEETAEQIDDIFIGDAEIWCVVSNSDHSARTCSSKHLQPTLGMSTNTKLPPILLQAAIV
jgi:hypothetical protein